MPVSTNGIAGTLQTGSGSSRTLIDYSNIKEESPKDEHEAEPEFLFDSKDDVDLSVDTPQEQLKLLEPKVSNLFAKRAKCDVWKSVIGLKIGKSNVEQTFDQLDAWECFKEGEEWQGHVGETVFHICFLLMGDIDDGMVTPLGLLAEKIHAKNTWFLNQPYGHGVYEGEVAMHLAVAHGDMGSVRWLLDQRADLEHNAIGQFFHRFRWGEHPVAWAACRGQNDVLCELLQSQADLNYTDTKGDTVLHCMALSPNLFDPDVFKRVYDELVRHDGKVVEHWRTPNKENRTPLQLAAAKEEGNFNAILAVLSSTMWQFGSVTCMAHPLAGWDSAHSRQYQPGNYVGDEEVSALEVAVLEENSQFFCVPLNQLLIKSKWELFVRQEFVYRCGYFFLFVILATCSACIHDGFRVAAFLRLWTFFLAIFMFGYYGFSGCRVLQTAYYQSTKSWTSRCLLLDLHKMMATTFVLASISMQSYLDLQEKGSQHHREITWWLYGAVEPLALILAWGCVLEFFLVYEYLSRILIVIVDIMKMELPVWMFLQSILLVAFSSAVYIATAKVYDEKHLTYSVFGSYWETVMSLALVPLGGIADVEELLASEHDVVVCFLYFLYATFSCVLFLNLTICLFTERTKEIMENAGKYYYNLLAIHCIAEEKRRRPQELRRYWIGSKLGNDKHHLIVQKFPKHNSASSKEEVQKIGRKSVGPVQRQRR